MVAQLPRHGLIALRRDENVGDRQPLPCFCVTTVGFWKRLQGDWRAGYRWNDLEGRPITDVGGNLLRQLEDARIDWMLLLRSNRIDRHPVFFAVYGGIVHHHGAGSRLLLPIRFRSSLAVQSMRAISAAAARVTQPPGS